MTVEQAKELQANIAKEAAALLVIYGTATAVDQYRKAVVRIGSAWSLPAADTQRWLELISEEEKAAAQTADPRKAEHVREEKDPPMNAGGLQTLDNIWGLFETAAELNSTESRRDMYRLARELEECRNLRDWLISGRRDRSALAVCQKNKTNRSEMMRYFKRQQRALEPEILLDSVLEEALSVLDLSDETAIDEISLHKRGAEIIAREYGLTVEDRNAFHRLERFEQEMKQACASGEPLPELTGPEGAQAGMLDILWSLFDLATALEDADERGEILDLAAYMMDFSDLEGKLNARVSQSA